MDAGFIRMRGYGDRSALSSRVLFSQLCMACGPFLEKNAGPATVCRFHDLCRWQEICAQYEELQQLMLRDAHQLLESAIPLCDEDAGYTKELFSQAGTSDRI